jgi:hypothetical protein
MILAIIFIVAIRRHLPHGLDALGESPNPRTAEKFARLSVCARRRGLTLVCCVGT